MKAMHRGTRSHASWDMGLAARELQGRVPFSVGWASCRGCRAGCRCGSRAGHTKGTQRWVPSQEQGWAHEGDAGLAQEQG